MDKKKVIELIKKGISYWNRSTYITSYEDDAKECFNEAIKELSKKFEQRKQFMRADKVIQFMVKVHIVTTH